MSPPTRFLHERIGPEARLVVKTLTAHLQEEAGRLGLEDMPVQADAVNLALRETDVDACIAKWRERNTPEEGDTE